MSIKQVLSYLDQDKLIQNLQEIVRIESVTHNPDEISRKVYDLCKEIGMNVEFDTHGNLISILKGSKPGKMLVFNSHMDTVELGENWTIDTPTSGNIVDGKLYGRGSVDCKGSIACQIAAAKTIKDSGIDFSGEIIFTHIAYHEMQNTDLKGTLLLIKDGFTADMGINGEGTYGRRICIAGNGMCEVLITTYGISAHGSTPEKGVNAISKMCKIIDKINQIEVGTNEYTGKGSVVVGTIQGGQRSSVVPELCTVKVSSFLIPGDSGETFLEKINKIIKDLKKGDTELNAKAELTYNSKSHQIRTDEPIVQNIIKAHEYLGYDFEISGTPQHCDADYMVNEANIPTVIFGPGQGHLAHMPDEYVEIEDLIRATKVYIVATCLILSEN